MGEKIVSWRAAGNGPTCIANCPTQGLAGSCGDSTSNKCGRRVSHNRRALQHTAEASMQHPMSDCRGEDLLIGEKKRRARMESARPRLFFLIFFFCWQGGAPHKLLATCRDLESCKRSGNVIDSLARPKLGASTEWTTCIFDRPLVACLRCCCCCCC